MKLLTPKEIKQRPDSLADEVRRGIKLKQLNEANKLSLVELQAKLDPEKQKIQKEFNEYVQSVGVRKSELLAEVTALERRKEKALEPLDEKWLELEEKEVQLSARESNLQKRVIQIETDKEQIKEQAISLRAKDQELSARESAVVEREKRSSTQTKLVKQETDKLNADKKDFGDLVTKKVAEISSREKQLTDREQALSITQISQSKREQELADKDKEIKDKYETLERTRKRAGKI